MLYIISQSSGRVLLKAKKFWTVNWDSLESHDNVNLKFQDS